MGKFRCCISSLLLHWILFYSAVYNIDSRLAFSVVQVESNGDKNKVGSVGERGVFQIRGMYTLYSDKALVDIKTNVREGIRLLAEAKRKCYNTIDNTFVVCFNRGITGGSRVQHPKQDAYYKRVMKAYQHSKFGGLDVSSKDAHIQQAFQKRQGISQGTRD